MSFEPKVIDNWIYDTLFGDNTLAELLAVDNLPPKYQQGVYNTLVPEIDVISKGLPKSPYIVFTLDGASNDEHALCGTRAFANFNYRITVWGYQSGALSFKSVGDIMDRVDQLLDNQQVTNTTPKFYFRRIMPGQTFSMSDGGRIEYGVTSVYQCTTMS